jgi:hypothetical protein
LQALATTLAPILQESRLESRETKMATIGRTGGASRVIQVTTFDFLFFPQCVGTINEDFPLIITALPIGHH